MIRPSGRAHPPLDADDHAVPVHGLANAGGGHVDVGLSGSALVGNDEPEALRAAGKLPTSRFMREGRPTRAPRIVMTAPSPIRRRSTTFSSRRAAASSERRLTSSRTETGLPRLDS